MYKIGDCLIHKQSRQLYEITRFYANKEWYGLERVPTNRHTIPVSMDVIANDFIKLDCNRKAARLLYVSNSIKAVTK